METDFKTQEEKMYTIGFKKYYQINQFFKLLKENAIDCQLHRSMDEPIMEIEDNIKCNIKLDEEILGNRYNLFSYNEIVLLYLIV